MSTYIECEQKIKELTEKKNKLVGQISKYEALQKELARYRMAAYDKSRSGKIIGIADKVAYEKVKELEKQIKELEPIPSNEEITIIDKELEDYYTQLKSLPRIMDTKTINAKIVGRWKYDCQGLFIIALSKKHNWYGYNAEGVLAPYTYDVIPNKENIPVQVKRYLRNSDTYGYLWCWIYNLQLDVLPTEDITPIVDKPIKPISRVEEGTTLGVMGTQVKTVSELVTKIKICSRCGKINRPVANYCQNCAKSLSGVPLTDKQEYTEKMSKSAKEKKARKKRRLF